VILRLFIAFLVILLLAVAVELRPEVVLALLFGWVSFLMHVIPRLRISWSSLAIASAALVLFTIGIHILGRRWRSGTASASSPSWRLRWSVAMVGTVILLFVAGISMVGVVHQTGWLLTAPEPMYVSTVRSLPSDSSQRHLRQFGLAVENYAATFGRLPAGGVFGPSGKPLRSWEVDLLAYVGNYQGYGEAKLAWNEGANADIARSALPEYLNPDMTSAPIVDVEGYGLSHYAANSRVMGANTRLDPFVPPQLGATTLLIGEVNTGFRPWAHPVNWRDPANGINRSPDGFGGPRMSGGAQFSMADGSVRFISENVSPDVLEALARPNRGAEVVDESVLEEPR